MSSLVDVTMSPEEMIFTFKQKSEESFKEGWSRIYDWHGKTEPKMTLSLLLSSFYFGLALCYRYALDATVEGDFLHCDGDQAFFYRERLRGKSPAANLFKVKKRVCTVKNLQREGL
jgi:hypothetical protein